MPFVRFSRDKRGYEHVYLIDSSKERGRSRVLYWFRTPPGVKVGRAPFDPDTQRSLERQNPDVQFDWPQIVAAKIAPPVPVENWREKRRAERAFKRARAAEAIEAEELERPADADNAVPMVEESDEPLDDLDDGLAEIVEVVADGGSATPGALETVSLQEPIPDTLLPAATAEVSGASAQRRRRRRRRRRGRGSGSRPETPAQSSPASNEPLDPPNPPEKRSNEE